MTRHWQERGLGDVAILVFGTASWTRGSLSPTAVAIAAGTSGAVRVAAGRTSSYTDSASNVWSADCCYNGGQTYDTTSSIAGTTDPALYQTERWNPAFTYTFPGLTPGATYQVTLKFAEIYWTQPG